MIAEIFFSWAVLLCWAMLGTSLQQALAADSTVVEIPIWPGVAPGSEDFTHEETIEHRENGDHWIQQVSRPTLTVYAPAAAENVGTGVVICPGGGYGGLSMTKEGHDLGRWFCQRGIVAGVLKYRHGGGPHKHPVPLNDAQRALRIMRSRAEQWNLRSDRIGIAGFSAGGHLASTAGTHVAEANTEATDPLERVSSRADFLVLVYPVITMQGDATHQGSRKNLLGKQAEDGFLQALSNERQVTAGTGPTFLVHASDDESVPVANSLLFYQALRQHHIPVEMHLYEKGGHGFGFYRGDRPADRWPDGLELWLQERGLIK